MKILKISLLLWLLATVRLDGMYIDPTHEQLPTYDLQISNRVAKAGQTIEPYQAARDFEIVSSIIKEYPRFLMHHQTLDRLLALLAQGNVPSISVLRVAGKTVGFVNLIVREKNWGRERYTIIAGIGVTTAQQGKGYGNMLLEYAIEVSKEKVHATTLELEVHQDNKKALAWYLSKGFTIDSYGTDGWIACSLSLITDKSKCEPAAVY